MNEATCAWILLIPALILRLVALFKKENEKPGKADTIIVIAGAILLGIAFIRRSLTISFVALTGTFESLIFYAFVICVIDAAYRLQKKIPYRPAVSLSAALAAFALLSIASSPLTAKEAFAPVPALRSFWLLLHVAFSFIGEAFFALSFGTSLAFLFSRQEEKKADYDRIAYLAVAAGYPFFTLGALVFGAIWAQQAWGVWWNWDPKETWALITWLTYTLYLHQRLISRQAGKLTAIIAVIGFLCALFSFFGVNYLLPGLHSYR